MHDAHLRWTCPHYSELTLDELYAAMQLRQQVFAVEQSCAYLDADGYDRFAWHLMGWVDSSDLPRIAAYARLFAPGDKCNEAAIGRVVSHPDMRGAGYGRALMREAIARVDQLFGPVPIRISAQRYLERFYTELGFVSTEEPYDEDGIPHIAMLLSRLN